MAISQSDGSIILSTKVDTTGLKNGTRDLRSEAAKLASEYRKAGMSQSEAFKKAWSEIERTKQATDKAKFSVTSFGTALKSIAKYFIGIQTILSAINFSNQAGLLATQTEASVQRIYDIYGQSSNVIGDFIDANAQALGMSKSAMASFSAVYGNLFSVWADQATNAELTNQYLQMTAVVASKTGRTVEDVQERVRSGLLGNTEAIEDLGVFVNVKTIEMTDAFQRMANGKSWEQLDAYTQQQVRTMAILEQATSKYGTEVAETSALTRSAFKSAYEDFQNTWGQVVNTVLMPILEVATQILNIFTVGLQSLFNLSGGILGDEVIEQQKASYNQQKKITEETENTGEALKDYTAGFDELNTIQKDSGGKDNGFSSDFNVSKQEAQDTSKNSKKISKDIQKTLLSIMGVVATALVAVGLILLFTGNIGWGIGFIVAGAGLLGVTMITASEFDYHGIVQMLTTIMGIAGGALLAIGIMLLYIGGVVGKGVAIGMIIAGGSLIVSAVTAQMGLVSEDVKAWLSLIMGIAGGALLALGVILCMVGSVALGVGMIVAGAVGIVSAVALNTNTVVELIRSPIGAIMSIVGGALLAIGIILVCTGVALPLGIALIALGAVSFVTPIALNWNTLVEKVKSVWKSIKDYWNANIAKYFTKEWWGNLAKNAINGFLKWIFDGLNKLVDKLNGFSFNLPSVLGGGKVGFNIKHFDVPQLAKGAVIPANKPFLAMLGDQKSGTNIETPLDTMVEAFNIALSNNNGGFNGRIEVPVIIDGREVLRAVRSNENAVGTQTVFGGFANAY